MKLLTSFFLLLCIALGSATVYQTGNKIENFTLTDVSANRPVSLKDYAGSKGVVLVFTSNYCPYAKLYEDRITALANQYQSQGIQFLLINSNPATESVDESVEEMAKYAKGKKLPMPYLADKDQKVRDQFNATKNPEVFVLQNNGGGTFILKYRGAIDDNPQAPGVATAFYLKDAIEAVLQKKNLALTERRAIGCMIKK